LDFEGDDGLQGREDIYLTIRLDTKSPKNFLLILNITKQ
jgi:hypothetical protein